MQIVSPAAVVSLTTLDVGGAGAREEREAEARRLVAREIDRPFDVARGPLLRTVVARVDDGVHVVGVALHHLIADAWSMTVFVRELLASHREEVLPPPSLQYADFAVWQRRRLQHDSVAERIAYWRASLAHLPEPLRRTADAPRAGCRVAALR